MEELKVLLEVVKDSAQSSTNTEPNIVLRFARLVDRATEIVQEASHLQEKLVKNPASLEDETVKTEIRKWSFLKGGENTLNLLVARLLQVQQSLHSALNCINT